MEEQITKLRDELIKLNDHYYIQDDPLVNDDVYDAKLKQLRELEDKYPEYEDPRSPTKTVGGLSPIGNVANHDTPMLSLDNAFGMKDLEEFLKRVGDVKIVMEPKIDGVALSLVYRNGKLVRGVTRGDGVIGEIVTANVLRISDVPKTIALEEDLEVRGEVYMRDEVLDEYNKEALKVGRKTLSNTRNATAGSLRLNDLEEVGRRNLNFKCYGAIITDSVSHMDDLELLEDLGFKTTRGGVVVVSGYEDMVNGVNTINGLRPKLGYVTDGIVLKVDSHELRLSLGNTSRVPKWAIAYKPVPTTATTTLLGIDYGLGRSGVITPVAVLKPVSVGGVNVSRCTLHNLKTIADLDLHLYDTLLIHRAGQTIPQILEVVKRGFDPIRLPTSCPECGAPTIRVTTRDSLKLMCSAPDSCRGVLLSGLLHFVGKGGLDIKGIGPSYLKRVVDEGLVTKSSDLFKLGDDSLSLDKVYALEAFINALGIPTIGKTTSKALAALAGDIEGLLKLSSEDRVSALPPVSRKAFLEYIVSPSNVALLESFIGMGFKTTNH